MSSFLICGQNAKFLNLWTKCQVSSFVDKMPSFLICGQKAKFLNFNTCYTSNTHCSVKGYTIKCAEE